MKLSPQARTRTLIWPSPGGPTSMSSYFITSGPPGLWTRIAATMTGSYREFGFASTGRGAEGLAAHPARLPGRDHRFVRPGRKPRPVRAGRAGFSRFVLAWFDIGRTTMDTGQLLQRCRAIG